MRSLLLALVVPAYAEPLRANRIVQFADRLVQEGKFKEAVLEYDRALFYFPEELDRPAVYRKLLTASVLGKDYLGSLELSRKVQESDRCIGAFFSARAQYGLAEFEPAKAAFGDVYGRCPEPERSDGAYWRGVADLRLHRWPEARLDFESVAESSPKGSQARKAAARLALPVDLSYRDPKLAGIFNAVLPGAGYLYIDSPRTALTALLVNGLFIWGTVASIHNGNHGAAAVLALFELGWYSGGIYGGVAGAHRFNRSAEDAWVKPFEID